jgi:hypothetical protein
MNSAMKKKASCIFGLGVVFMMFFVNNAFSGMECEGTQYGGVYYKKGRHYYPIKNGVKYDCEACGTCTPMLNSFGSSSAMPYGAGLSPAQQMAYSLALPLLSSALAMPSDNYDDIQQQQEALQKAQQEAAQKEEDDRRKALDLLNASAERNNPENLFGVPEERGPGLPASGELSPNDFTVKTKAGSRPEETGGTGTSKQPQFQQLLCAAYFSRLAEEAAKSGDEDKARFMGKQAEIVMSGGTPEIACQYPPAPDVPVPPGKEPTADTGLIAMVQQDIQDLRDVDAQLQAIDKQKKQSRAEKNQLETEIAAIGAVASDHKADDDAFLLQKKKDLVEIEKDLAALETDRKQLISRQNEIKNNLTKVRDSIQAGLPNK